MTVDAKICGINTTEALTAASDSGARFVGFVFFPRSPRHLSFPAAGELARATPTGITRVALMVEPDDGALDSLVADVPVDLLQLHGAETPERVADIKRRTGLPVMKAISIAVEADIDRATPYLGIADRLLFDAKAPKDMKGAMPGGNAVSFDWNLLAGRTWPIPWMLSGGLDPDNVIEAVTISSAPAVDVSSGVESAPGRKDPAKIRAFLERVSRL